jgi:hypothetical protein
MPIPREVSRKEVEEILKETKLKPAVIKGTSVIRFVKKPSEKFEYITTDQLYKIVNEKNLQIKASGTYLMVFNKEK